MMKFSMPSQEIRQNLVLWLSLFFPVKNKHTHDYNYIASEY